MNIKDLSRSFGYLHLVESARIAELGRLYIKGSSRVPNALSAHLTDAFAFEEYVRTAHNWRHPLNRMTLMESSNFPDIDAVLKDGTQIQIKNTANRFYQNYGVEKLNRVGGGNEIVPKGCKTSASVLVEESSVTQSMVKMGSEAVKAGKAAAVIKNLHSSAQRGAVIGIGIEVCFQAWQLHKNKSFGNKEALVDSAKEIAEAGALGAVSGVAIGAFGIVAASAALPATVTFGGGIVVGVAATAGARKIAKCAYKQLKRTRPVESMSLREAFITNAS